MSLELRAYPDYRKTGLHWLGAVPKHWRVQRAKSVFRCIDVRSSTGDEELLTVSSNDGVVPRREKAVTMFMAESYVGHKLCWPGDLVINSLWAWARGLGFSKYHGIISTAYGVYRPAPALSSYSDYFDYLFRSDAYDWELHVRSKGIWTSRLQLTDSSFLDMPVVLPPPTEAHQIALFLDNYTQLSQRLIRAKRRQIELLNEQKQAIIHQAVTRGLNPDVPLKPSGVEWLGDVPAHWEVRPLKRWVTINVKTLPESTESDYEFRYIDIGLVSTGFLTGQPERITFGASPSRARRIVSKGDTIVSTVRTYLKAVYFIAEEPQDLIASTGFAVLSPTEAVDPEMVGFAVRGHNFVERVSANSVGIAYPAISEGRLASFPLVLPPSCIEQCEIVQHIKQETRFLDTAISRYQREIDLIREYRTRLIADVVTGKLDVRGVELPELGEADDVPWDEDDDTGDGEIEDVVTIVEAEE